MKAEEIPTINVHVINERKRVYIDTAPSTLMVRTLGSLRHYNIVMFTCSLLSAIIIKYMKVQKADLPQPTNLGEAIPVPSQAHL